MLIILEILQEPVIKITEAKDVRWLSHDKVVQSIRRCFSSIITSLEREAKERGDAQALGLAAFVQKFDFIATLYMMCDLLPPLSQLSKALQVTLFYKYLIYNSVNCYNICTVKIQIGK